MRVAVAALLLTVLCIDNSCIRVAAKSVIQSKPFSARNEADMRVILETYNREGSLLCNKLSQANWDVQTHVDTADQYSPIQVSCEKGIIFLRYCYVIKLLCKSGKF